MARFKPVKKVSVKEKAPLVPQGFRTVAPGVVIGSVPLEAIAERRPRFRAMNSLQKRTLSRSFGKFGIKTLPIVRALDDGKYEIVDGHHRVDEMRERGMVDAPVLLFVDNDGKPFSAKDTDLAMLSLNVTADEVHDTYMDFLHELGSDLGAETVASFSAQDDTVIEDLLTAFDSDMYSGGDSDVDYNATPWDDAKEEDSTKNPTRGTPLMIPLPNTDEVTTLLEKATERFRVDSYAEAVVSALRYSVRLTRGKEK